MITTSVLLTLFIVSTANLVWNIALGVLLFRATRALEETKAHFNTTRFTIEQRFAGDFDPDRIAVAFGRDRAEYEERQSADVAVLREAAENLQTARAYIIGEPGSAEPPGPR